MSRDVPGMYSMICPKLELLEGPMVVVAVFGAGGEFKMGIFFLDPRLGAVKTRKEPTSRSASFKVHSLSAIDTRTNAKCRQGAIDRGGWGLG